MIFILLIAVAVAIPSRPHRLSSPPPLPPGFTLPAPAVLLTSPKIVALTEAVIQPREIHLGPEATNGTVTVFICTNVFQFQWMAETNKSYEVECSHDLKMWAPTGVIWQGKGKPETWTASLGTGRRVFFRIRIL